MDLKFYMFLTDSTALSIAMIILFILVFGARGCPYFVKKYGHPLS